MTIDYRLGRITSIYCLQPSSKKVTNGTLRRNDEDEIYFSGHSGAVYNESNLSEMLTGKRWDILTRMYSFVPMGYTEEVETDSPWRKTNRVGVALFG